VSGFFIASRKENGISTQISITNNVDSWRDGRWIWSYLEANRVAAAGL
jgi:hypothetical protein